MTISRFVKDRYEILIDKTPHLAGFYRDLLVLALCSGNTCSRQNCERQGRSLLSLQVQRGCGYLALCGTAANYVRCNSCGEITSIVATGTGGGYAANQRPVKCSSYGVRRSRVCRANVFENIINSVTISFACSNTCNSANRGEGGIKNFFHFFWF